MRMANCLCHLGLSISRPPTVPPRRNLLGGPSFCHLLHRPPLGTRLVCMSYGNIAIPKAPVDFGGSVWGDFFLNNTPQHFQKSDEWMRERAKKLKEEVNGLFKDCQDVVKKMDLVDVLQRLGIDHLFEEQIDTTLRSIHSSKFDSSSVRKVALRFRLLRQHGFWVSPEEFNKFKHEDGTFINELTSDPKGLLSLYNAAHLLTHNETALEGAIMFARNHLELMKSGLKSPLAEQVTRALQIPLPRTLKRLEAVNYISEYKMEEQTYNPSILELAKLDFTLLQHLHTQELKAVSQWWKDLSTYIGLDYVRDRGVECYFASCALYYEKENARARMILAKIIMLWSILDDTYDARATLEESQILNEAIQRWDESAASLLPGYLKKFFVKVIRSVREFEDELEPHQKYRTAYIKKAFQRVSHAHLKESEWFHENYIPSIKDKMCVSSVTGGGQIMCVGLLLGMGDLATIEAFEWAIGCSNAVRACGEMGRYMNDMAEFQLGRNEKDVASSVECYIKEHNVTSDVALAKICDLIEDTWKTMNEALFEHHNLLPVVQRLTNYARIVMFINHEKIDAYTYSEELKATIKIQYVDPIKF
ncbi:hypothetical protein ACP70R_031471 [Stipagrostis hirtigluma subsp. patula]